MSYALLARSRTLAGALAIVGASSLALASGASAKTFNVSNTTEFVKAVGEANGDAEANTIEDGSGGMAIAPAEVRRVLHDAAWLGADLVSPQEAAS